MADVRLVVALLLVATAASGRHSVRASGAAGLWRRLGRTPVAGAFPAKDPPASPPTPRWLSHALATAALDLPAAAVWRSWLATVATAAVGGLLLGGPGLALLAAASAVAGPLLAWWLLRGRGEARYAAALPSALESVARSLRSGASLVGALAEAADATPLPLAADLGAVVTATRRGVPLADALRRWAGARRLPPVRLVVASLSLGIETGGPQAQAVEGVAATLREQLALAAEIRASTSQARASALVISLAPLVFGVVAAAADPRSAAFLLRTPLGLACLAAGLCLDGVAAVWMARLARPPR